jgi:DNA-directed RNA polymerase specialized sigma24 family protein
MPSNDESVTQWIDDLKAGDQAAAQPLWERYFERLVRLARKKLQNDRRPRTVEDEEDAALSAFDSFCRGVDRGRFPRLTDRDDLWKLLVTITLHKVTDQVERAGRQKRGGGHVIEEAALVGPDAEREPEGLDQFPAPGPTPEFAALVAEQYEHLLARLDDGMLRSIAVWKLEGYTNEEIATKLGCALRTVANRLALIRMKWERSS